MAFLCRATSRSAREGVGSYHGRPARQAGPRNAFHPGARLDRLCAARTAVDPMSSIDDVLKQYVKDAAPTETQQAQAERSPAYLREKLSDSRFGGRILETYLSGSYARKTAIYPLDDVDIVFVIDPGRWDKEWLRELPKPKRVLSSFARAVKRHPSYKQTRVVLQRRSIRLQLSGLNIDVVPAVAAGREHFVRIPDQDADEWIISAPRLHTQLMEERHNKCQFRLKPMIRLLKWWNNRLASQTRVKSFAVETMAAKVLTATTFSSYEEGALLFFDFVAGRGGLDTLRRWSDDHGVSFGGLFSSPRLMDLAGTGSNLLERAKKERLERFAKRAATAREWIPRRSAPGTTTHVRLTSATCSDDEMALAAVAARVAGDLFQGMVFWYHAAELLSPRAHVARVILEHDEAAGVDDVAVRYEPPGIDDGGRHCLADFYQVKHHVDQKRGYSSAALIDPDFIDCKESLLERFAAAHVRLSGRVNGWYRLHLVSNSGWDRQDHLGPVLRQLSGGTLPDEFFTSGARSRLGAIRSEWQAHLRLPAAAFEDFARRLRFDVNYLARPGFRAALSDRLEFRGLRPIPVERAQNPYDSLVQQFLLNGRNEWHRDSFKAMCEREGLLALAPKALPRTLAVQSFRHFGNRIEDDCDRHRLRCWSTSTGATSGLPRDGGVGGAAEAEGVPGGARAADDGAPAVAGTVTGRWRLRQAPCCTEGRAHVFIRCRRASRRKSGGRPGPPKWPGVTAGWSLGAPEAWRSWCDSRTT